MDAVRLMWACLWLAAPLAAQMLRVEAAAAAPGGTAIVPLVFEAAEARPVAALEFELAAPAGRGIEARLPAASSAASAAGKSLACSGTWNKASTAYLWTCILAGGREPIPSGVVASAALAISPKVRPAAHTVGLERVKGAGPDSRPVPVQARPGKLKIE